MDPRKTLVLATRNKGKTVEIRNLLEGFPITIKNLDDFGPLPEVVEDGETFDENAYKKSSFTARVLGYPALADDSGLSVCALNGRPGVHSARYGGPEAKSDAERYDLLLKEMVGCSNRRAVFTCVLSLAVPSGPALTYEASCEGEIAVQPSGTHGFGYDPVFYFPPLGKTFAEMDLTQKSRISHRGKALVELREEFDKVLLWISRHM